MELRPHDDFEGIFEQLKSAGYSGRVTVRLRGGSEVNGTVGETGSDSVIIKALSRREFFDAYVRYEHITCVEVQVRS